MAKFEESRPSHEVHEVKHPMGHGMLDQKHSKGMRSPIVSAIPSVDNGSEPGTDGAGSPGVPSGMYGAQDQTGS